MIVTQYSHRLPADYDMDLIHARALRRGPEFDATPGLILKAFLTRVRGRHGATDNRYSSLYLWRETQALWDFFAGPRFVAVTETFGRPPAETWLAMAAYAGPAARADWATREEIDLPADTDLARLRAEEEAWLRDRARAPDIRAAFVAMDLDRWRLARFVLSAEAPREEAGRVSYAVPYLAVPELSALPKA